VRLLGSHLRRLVRRPASWITLGMLAAMIALVFIALAASAEQAAAQPGGEAILQLLTFPIAYTFVLAFVIQIGSLFAVIYFAAGAGSEWNWGTFKNAVARGESRSRYVLAGYVALGLLAGIGLLIVFVVGVGAAIVGAGIAGLGTDGIGDQAALLGLPDQLWRAWLALAEAGAIGFVFATLARSPLAGVGAGIALYFVEEFAGLLLPDVVRWLPFNAAAAVISGADMSGIEGGGGPNPLDPAIALAVVLAWLIGSLAVAAAYSERAEITG
jgi:ABC-2 type transport system permease protein